VGIKTTSPLVHGFPFPPQIGLLVVNQKREEGGREPPQGGKKKRVELKISDVVVGTGDPK